MERIIKPAEYDYIEMKKVISELKEKYPFIKVSNIGKSVAGRDIPVLQIANAGESVLFAGGFHGTERITASLLLKYVEKLCDAIKNDGIISGLSARRAMFGHSLMVVPVVNPDGCEVAQKGAVGCGYLARKIQRLCSGDFESWDTNLRGVDINHNFSAGWKEQRELEKREGVYGPGPKAYGGPQYESEPETVALVELCRKVKIRHALSFCTKDEAIYWNYGKSIPARSSKMAEIMAESTGYSIEVPTGLEYGGGFKDWFISEFDRPAFNVGAGNKQDPRDLPNTYKRLEEMLVLSTLF